MNIDSDTNAMNSVHEVLLAAFDRINAGAVDFKAEETVRGMAQGLTFSPFDGPIGLKRDYQCVFSHFEAVSSN